MFGISRLRSQHATVSLTLWLSSCATAAACSSEHDQPHRSAASDTADIDAAVDGGTDASSPAPASAMAGREGATTLTPGSAGAGASAAGGGSNARNAAGSPASAPPAIATYPPLEFAKIGTPSVIASTYSLAEGPIWDHCANSLLFVDVNKSNRFELKDGNITTLTADSGCTNGMAFDIHGDLLLAQMGCSHPGNVSKRDRRSGNVTILASAGPMGEVFHTPDDITQRSDGTIYFSDGDFTHAMHTQAKNASTALLPIYRIRPDGTLVSESLTNGPNGIELSPDEKTLYVSAYFANQVLKFDVQSDGSLKAAGTLVTGAKNADSLCVDVQGNVYVGTALGLVIVRPDGTQLGTIPVKAFGGNKAVTSCDFGGNDGKTLFVSAWTTLSKIEAMPIPGQTWAVNRRLACP